MGYAELIQEQLKKLSLEKQAEVYDFVAFVAARSTHGIPGDEESSIAFSMASMTKAMRGLEDDPVVYTSEDLKERFQ